VETIPIPHPVLLNTKGRELKGLSLQAEVRSPVLGNGHGVVLIEVRVTVNILAVEPSPAGAEAEAAASATSPWLAMSPEALRWHLDLDYPPATPGVLEQAAKSRLSEGPYPLIEQLSKGRLPFVEEAVPGFLHLGERSDLKTTAKQTANLVLGLLVGPLFEVLMHDNGVVFARWDSRHPTLLETLEEKAAEESGRPPDVRGEWERAGVMFSGSTANPSSFAVAIYRQLASGVWNCREPASIGARLAGAVKNATLGAWIPRRLLPGLHLMPVLDGWFAREPTWVRPDVDADPEPLVDLFAVMLLCRLATGELDLAALVNEPRAGKIAKAAPVLVAKSVRRAVAKFASRWPPYRDRVEVAAKAIIASGASKLARRVLEGAVLLGLVGVSAGRPNVTALDALRDARERRAGVREPTLAREVAASRLPDWIQRELILVDLELRAHCERLLLRLDKELADLEPAKRPELLHLALRKANPTTVEPGFLSLLRDAPGDVRAHRILAAMLRLHRSAHGWTALREAAEIYGLEPNQLRAWEELDKVDIGDPVAGEVLAWFRSSPSGVEQLGFLERTLSSGYDKARERHVRLPWPEEEERARLKEAARVLKGKGLWEHHLGTLTEVGEILGASNKMIAEPMQWEVLQGEQLE
jgi:hypothetical protein